MDLGKRGGFGRRAQVCRAFRIQHESLAVVKEKWLLVNMFCDPHDVRALPYWALQTWVCLGVRIVLALHRFGCRSW